LGFSLSRERWAFRDLERQLEGAPFERVVLSPAKPSTPSAELHCDAATVFKDSDLVAGWRRSWRTLAGCQRHVE